MHEFGIADSILQKTLEVARANGGKPVERVHVLVGTLKLVVPEMLSFAFEALAEGTLAQRAVLECEPVSARVRCRSCRQVFTPEDVFWVCPACAAPGGEVLAGDELMLQSVVLMSDEPLDYPSACGAADQER